MYCMEGKTVTSHYPVTCALCSRSHLQMLETRCNLKFELFKTMSISSRQHYFDLIRKMDEKMLEVLRCLYFGLMMFLEICRTVLLPQTCDWRTTRLARGWHAFSRFLKLSSFHREAEWTSAANLMGFWAWISVIPVSLFLRLHRVQTEVY